MGKPTLIFRDVTERIEGLDHNAVISHFDENIVMEFVENYKGKQKNFLEIQDSPSEKILKYLKKI